MEKRDFVFRENQLFLRKGWRNKGLSYRPPSVPQKSIPFSTKQTLYELIQEQNSKELPMIDPGDKIISNLSREIPRNIIAKPRSANLQRTRIKTRANLQLDIDNLSRSEAAGLKGSDFSEGPNPESERKRVLSYREKVQGLEREILKEKSLASSLRGRKITRIDDTESLIRSARSRETARIEGIMSDLRLKTAENRRFHDEIREKLDKFGRARLEIDQNFAIFEDCVQYRNIEFLRDFSSVYRTSANCPHRAFVPAARSKPSGSHSHREYSDKPRTETGNVSLFTIKVQRIDSHKSRVILRLDTNQELAFVTSEGCENYLKLDQSKPELRYLGNDNHDKSLLFDLEQKLLDDLRLQRLNNQTLLSRLTDRPSTPDFPQKAQKEDQSISIYLNLSTEADLPSKLPCEVCRAVNAGFKAIFSEIFKVDRKIEADFRDIDQAFRESAKEGEFLEDLLGKVAEKFRNVARNCFKILPNHAFFFEKCFKIMAFAQENAARKYQATVSQILGR